MKRLVCCTLLATAAMAQNFPIDHVTVAGRDLKAMTEALRKATGITAEYGGPHSNHATEMALASFPDGSYLELIAIQPHADPAALAAHYWHKFLESDGGPCAWAIRPAAYGTEAERLRKTGVAVTDWHRAGRERPDGVELDWETAQIGTTNGGLFPFMIHDFTPRGNRAFPSGMPTTDNFAGVLKVVIGVRDIGIAVAQHRQAYGLPMPQLQDDAAFGAKLAWFPGTPVILAAPLNASSWLNARVQEYGDAPCAFVIKSNFFFDAGKPARKPSNWFGSAIFWYDTAKLGWHLGFEIK